MYRIKIKSIATDIDGVVLALGKYQLEKGYKHFEKKSITVKDDTKYSIKEIYGVSRKEELEFWKKYIWQYSMFLKANRGVSEIIKKWQQENKDVPVITSRVFVTEKNFLGSLFRMNVKLNLLLNSIHPDGVHFCGEDTSAKEKADVAEKESVDALIDDKIENCLEIAKRGMIAFCLDNKWNQGFEHENVIRVKDFYEVDRYLRMLAEGIEIKEINYKKLQIGNNGGKLWKK